MQALGLKRETYIYKPQGCPYCGGTGYRGRVAVHEILYLDQKLKSHISSEKLDFESLKTLAQKNGMVTLSGACREYVLDGTTSLDEYMSIVLGDR